MFYSKQEVISIEGVHIEPPMHMTEDAMILIKFKAWLTELKCCIEDLVVQEYYYCCLTIFVLQLNHDTRSMLIHTGPPSLDFIVHFL
jgi:hypothetical protein